MHFEELWEDAEKLLETETNISELSELVTEFKAKLSIYEALDSTENLSKQDLAKLKGHTFGKLLLLMTQISAKDGINVFAALRTACNNSKIEALETKYKI